MQEASQIVMKRREVKGKGEKETYTHLNAEFQRIARRDKKAFLSDQGQEIEENKIMGKTRDLFKKIKEIPLISLQQKRYQGNISCKDGHNKRQKWYGPNRSRRYEQEVATIHRRIIQKKDPHDPDNHNGMTTHLEPDILE